MLTLKNISKSFNRNTPYEVHALNSISLEVADTEFLIIIGSNGSGKTTLLNALAGTLFPDNGTIEIDHRNITRLKDYERSKWIGRVFQDPLKGTAPDLSVLDNFRLAFLRTQSKGLSIGTGPSFKKRVQDQLSRLRMNLENKIFTLAGKLSGGQRQALTLLMATFNKPRILLMDEPTASLDPKSSEIVMKLADDLIREDKLTAILVTHNLLQAVNYGTNLIMMQEGKITYAISPIEKKNLAISQVQSWFV
jgi:putative tryptophan/tyrosine transport system ATP-binding protein